MSGLHESDECQVEEKPQSESACTSAELTDVVNAEPVSFDNTRRPLQS